MNTHVATNEDGSASLAALITKSESGDPATPPALRRRQSNPDLLDKKQAADFLTIAVRTLDDWRKAKLIRCIQRGGYVRFRRGDLEEFLAANTLHPVAVLAATSASSRFTERHLAKLSGRRVRIIADNDAAGADWCASLRAAGCVVDAVRLPGGMKDLGDALRAIPAGDSFWQQLLTF